MCRRRMLNWLGTNSPISWTRRCVIFTNTGKRVLGFDLGYSYSRWTMANSIPLPSLCLQGKEDGEAGEEAQSDALPPRVIPRNNKKQKDVGTRQMAARPGLGFGFFLAVHVTRFLLIPTTTFNNGFDITPTERARCRPSNVRCVHPSFEHREGRLWHSTGSNCSRFR
jgi:hypothetical protein